MCGKILKVLRTLKSRLNKRQTIIQEIQKGVRFAAADVLKNSNYGILLTRSL